MDVSMAENSMNKESGSFTIHHALAYEVPLVRQGYDSTCSAASLKMVLDWLGVRNPGRMKMYRQMRQECCGGGNGVLDSGTVANYARRKGVSARRGRTTLSGLRGMVNGFSGTPIIVSVAHRNGGSHSIVVQKVTWRDVIINDPLYGKPYKESHRKFSNRWSGKYLQIW